MSLRFLSLDWKPLRRHAPENNAALHCPACDLKPASHQNVTDSCITGTCTWSWCLLKGPIRLTSLLRCVSVEQLSEYDMKQNGVITKNRPQVSYLAAWWTDTSVLLQFCVPGSSFWTWPHWRCTGFDSGGVQVLFGGWCVRQCWVFEHHCVQHGCLRSALTYCTYSQQWYNK